ncbi:MAG TPA: hypothetical protein VNS58_19170 [Puia sp.]|nr:hypothetical protein [Puia sp.]
MYTISSKCFRKNPETRSILSQLFLLSLFTLLLFSSCKKGDTGPAGATGAAGATGSAGPTGATGSANVIYSAWFTPATYVKDTVFGTYGFIYDKATTDITQPVLDSGVVLVYGKLDGYITSVWPTAQVAVLPINITYMIGSSPNIDTWSALATLGNLRIQLQSSLNAYDLISTLHQFRYIIIPGGTKSAVASVKPGISTANGIQLDAVNVRKVLNNYQEMSYAEVCQLLKIPE